jgi:hypothetical protein
MGLDFMFGPVTHGYRMLANYPKAQSCLTL